MLSLSLHPLIVIQHSSKASHKMDNCISDIYLDSKICLDDQKKKNHIYVIVKFASIDCNTAQL